MFLMRTLFIVSLSFFSFSVMAVDYLKDAQAYIAKGEIKPAIIQLKNQLKNKPKDAQARYLIGKLYLTQSNLKAALKELGIANELDANNQQYKLAYSQALLLTREHTKALEYLKFTAEGDTENLRVVYEGYANLGLKQVEKAKANFQAAINQEFVEGYIGLAKISLMEKEFKQADLYAQKVTKQQADNLEAISLRAKALNLLKKHKQALALYSDLIKQRPNSHNYLLDRASTHIALKDNEKAEEDIQNYLSKNPKQPFANYLLAQVKLKSKDYASARNAAQSVLNVSTHHYPSKLIMGISNYALGNLNQADKNLTEYLSSKPNNYPIQNLLSNVYLAQKKPYQAILMLEGIQQETLNKYPSIMTTLGSAYLLVGEHQKGVELLNTAKTLAPDNMAVQKRLIAGQLQGGDRSSAISGLEQVAKNEKDNKKVHYLLIISYIQEKLFDKAYDKVNSMLAGNKKDPLLYNFLSVIENIKGNKDKAKKAYEDALGIDKKFIPAYMGLAKFAFSEGNEKKAKELFQQVITINPKYLASHLALASLAEKSKQNDQAEKHLLDAYQNNKGQIKSQLKVLGLLGKWYAKFKQPEKLLPLGQDLIKQHPEDLSALSFLAGVQMVNGKNQEAQSTLKNIVARSPKDTKHRVLYANLLAKEEGMKEQVLSVLEQVYSNDTQKPQGLIFQVNYLIKQKDFNQAFATTKRIENLFPNEAIGKKLQGDIFWVQNQRDKAINLYQQAYQKKPGIKSLFFLSELMLKEKKADIAFKFLNDELKNQAKNAVAQQTILLKIASSYQQLKQENKAITHYQKVLGLKKDNILALNNLAWIYFKQGTKSSLNKALSMAQEAYKKAEKSPQVADTYAVILLEQEGQQKKALEVLQKAAKQAINDYDIQFHLAKAYAVNGQREEAVKVLRLISSSDKEFSEKDKAAELLAKLEH